MRNTYRVKSGETPADIAEKHTGNRDRYIDLIPLNPQIGEQVSSVGRPVFNRNEWRDHMIVNIPSDWTGMQLKPTLPTVKRSSSTIRSRYNCSHTVKGPIPVKSYLYVVQKEDFGNSQFSRSNITPKIAEKFNVSGDRWFEMLNANYDWKGGFVFEGNTCMPSGLKADDLLKIPASWPPPNPGVAVRTASGFTTTNNSGLAGASSQQVSLHTSPQKASSQQVSLHTSPQKASSQQVSLHTSPQKASSQQVSLDQRQSQARESRPRWEEGLAGPRITGLGEPTAEEQAAAVAYWSKKYAEAQNKVNELNNANEGIPESVMQAAEADVAKAEAELKKAEAELKKAKAEQKTTSGGSTGNAPSNKGKDCRGVIGRITEIKPYYYQLQPDDIGNFYLIPSKFGMGTDKKFWQQLRDANWDWDNGFAYDNSGVACQLKGLKPNQLLKVPASWQEPLPGIKTVPISTESKEVKERCPPDQILTGNRCVDVYSPESPIGPGSGLETVGRKDDGDDSTIWILLAVGAAVAGGIYMYNARKGK